MFSCVLLQGDSAPNDVLVAEMVSLDLQVISSAGRGTACCRYSLDRNYKDVVAYVPSSVCGQDASTQQIKVTKCDVKIEGEGTSDPQCTSVELTKLDCEYSNLAKNIPTYANVKKHLRRSVSPDDLMLYLGDFETNTTVMVQFQFLLQLKLNPQVGATSSYPLYHIIENSIPTKHISYKLKLATQLQIVDVTPILSTLTNFNWFHLDKSKRVIHVDYDLTDLHRVNYSAGFCIELANHPTQSACCTCLVQMDPYDGVMMLSSNVTQEQMSLGGTSENFSPSEFVFLVDCSASMNPFMDGVIATLITSIKSLPHGCYFNMIAFGSSFRQLFHESKEYSKSSVKNAVEFANQLKASLGGTELLPPLKWIYKKSRKMDMPCQIFIITDVDEDVKDIPILMNAIKKNKHHSRCHTFGIGLSICEPLVTRIAEASGGRSVIIQEGDRIQTKVMEVLKESLNNFIMDAEIKWQPPRGYSVVHSTPKSLGVVYSQQSHSAFAFLKKTSSGRSNCIQPVAPPPATIAGRLRGQEVEIPIREASLPLLAPVQTSELASIIGRVGKWTQLSELEITRLQSISRKNSTEEEECDQEPRSKRPRLNGETCVQLPLFLSPNEVKEDLLKLSLDSGISCPFTYFRSGSKASRSVIQILPFSKEACPNPLTSKCNNKNGITANHQKKYSETRRNHHRKLYNSRPVENQQQQEQLSTVAALAKRTISTVTNSVMTMVNIFNPDVNSMLLLDGGKTIEDELEIEKRKGTQLYWDERKNEIKYPSIYYQSSKSGANQRVKHSTSSEAASQPHRKHGRPPINGHCKLYQPNPSSLPSPPELCSPPTTTQGVDNSSSSDDEDGCLMISDSESDSSVDLDWESLPKTREYLPIIQMQLFSGAWPMVHGFSYAVRVPLGEICNLPLLNQQPENLTCENNKVMAQRRKYGSRDMDDESNAHFWTTALAVVCFRECFPEFEGEWELIVHKGEHWLEQNLSLCALSMSEVQDRAKELLFRNL